MKRSGAIEWSSRTLDLTPRGYILRVYLEGTGYFDRKHSAELENKTTKVIAIIDEDTCKKVYKSWKIFTVCIERR